MPRDLLPGERVGVVRIGSLYITAALPAAAVFLVAAPTEGMGAATGGAVAVVLGFRPHAPVPAWLAAGVLLLQPWR